MQHLVPIREPSEPRAHQRLGTGRVQADPQDSRLPTLDELLGHRRHPSTRLCRAHHVTGELTSPWPSMAGLPPMMRDPFTDSTLWSPNAYRVPGSAASTSFTAMPSGGYPPSAPYRNSSPTPAALISPRLSPRTARWNISW